MNKIPKISAKFQYVHNQFWNHEEKISPDILFLLDIILKWLKNN